eukprot:7565482-Heterocapsa_arctica.AAC.1
MHKVPTHLEEEVAKQDALVDGLLQMKLKVMEHVHDKAPARNKEEKQAQEEAQRKFQGQKTGPHGEHIFADKEG